MHQAIDDLAQILPERYARTTVSQRIEDAVQYARSAGCAVVIRGPAGMGKSSALADICRRTPEAVAFEIVQVQKTRKGLFNSLADALAVYHDRTFTRDLYDVLTYRLEDAARQGNFVMADEVQNAGTDGVRTLMELQRAYRNRAYPHRQSGCDQANPRQLGRL